MFLGTARGRVETLAGCFTNHKEWNHNYNVIAIIIIITMHGFILDNRESCNFSSERELSKLQI